MIRQLENGKRYKILPFIINGEQKWGIRYTSLIVDNELISTDYGSILDEIEKRVHRNKRIGIFFSRKYAFLVYSEGEMFVILIGRKLMDILLEDRRNFFDIGSDAHLEISIEYVRNQSFKSYDKSNIIKIEGWSDGRDWLDYIEKNSPDILGFLNKKNPILMRDKLSKGFTHDHVGDIISERRSKKLETLFD